jgi:hypothetical protein
MRAGCGGVFVGTVEWDGVGRRGCSNQAGWQAPPRSALGVPAAAQAEWRGKFGDVAVWMGLIAPSSLSQLT